MRDTRSLVTAAILSALAVVMAILINFPIFPTMPYLKFDAGDIAILLGAFALGPRAALVISAIAAILMASATPNGGGIVGAVMHFLSSGTLAFTASLLYHRSHNKNGALSGLILGTIAMTAVMLLAWVTIVPKFWGMPLPEVMKVLWVFVLPFNLIKGAISGTVTFLLYKRLRFLLKRD